MKDEIRQKLKIKRKYFAGIRREEADKAILEQFLSLYGGYDSFFIYNSFSTEATTGLIVQALLDGGKRVYLPRVEGENIVAVPYGELKQGPFGIAEPLGHAFEGDIDITVIPLLAINGQGFRIGYGKGYYDRYLNGKKTKKVGLGYFFQFDNFKEDEWDIPLDEYLCERGKYTFEHGK